MNTIMRAVEQEPQIQDHVESCRFHAPISSLHCSARQGSHLVCGRTVDLRYYDQGWMPRCFTHRACYVKAGYCTALEKCGFPCGMPFEWESQMLQSCVRHAQEASCYFLLLPGEIRVQIYRYLLPDLVVPARFQSRLRSDGQRVNIAILRTCQIH
ncbi:hypothetical protein BJY01DRAFT_209997 [Aspergillus pseudoustus]|uniref:Probable treble clef zinc finger fungi domain-containing protein n=1 Tax=Aspergillus pseudoustus TaxID=1810923 RepID=A0ABR4KDE0_9EURO